MKHIYLIWIIALVVKLAIGAWLPLSADEAYYWVWGHHLQWSYYDHPPFTSWLFWLGQAFEGFGSAVRWPAIVVAHCTLLIWIEILKPLTDVHRIKWWLILALTAPLLGPGSLIITPDIPLLFFWSLALLSFQKLLSTSKLHWAVFLGASLGLGFSSKYHIVLFVPFALLYLVWQRRSLVQVLTWMAIALPAFFAGSFPVWYWNFQNEFVSFAFQLNHGLGASSWRPKWTFGYVISQLALVFPTVVVMALRRQNPSPLWLKIFAWAPLAFFFLTSFKGRVEANWPITAYPALLSVAVIGWKNWAWARITIGIWVAAFALVLSQVAIPWVPIKDEDLRTHELRMYETLAQRVDRFQPLYARTYQMASKLSFELKRPIYKLKGMNRVDFYDFRPESVPQASSYYVAVHKKESLPDWAKKEGHRIKDRISITDKYDVIHVEVQ